MLMKCMRHEIEWLVKIRNSRIERGLKGMRLGNCEVWISHLQKQVKVWLKFIEIWLRKWKGKSMGFWPQGLLWKRFGWGLLISFWKMIFLSIKPKHSSKHTILNIHLNMHILAIYLMWCVCMCRCLCRCTSLESIVLYIIP